jgi:hypothetical protein
MATQNNFSARDGRNIQPGRPERRGWPGYSPAIQPGNAPLHTEPPPESRPPEIAPPDQRPMDPRSFGDVAMATMLGIQEALASPHVRMLLQTALDNMARATFKPTVQPPWVTMPFRGVAFGGGVSMTAPNAGNPWTTFTDGTTTLSFTMADGMMGVVKEFGQDAVSPTDWDSLAWRLTVNGTPIFPWNNVSCQVGSMVDPRPVQIILRPGDTIALQVRNSSGADITNVGGWLYGWMWPVAVAGDVLNAHGQASVA